VVLDAASDGPHQFGARREALRLAVSRIGREHGPVRADENRAVIVALVEAAEEALEILDGNLDGNDAVEVASG
jgi:hypothetical protein